MSNITGKPTSYHSGMPEIARRAKAKGLRDEVVADIIGISTDSYYKYKRVHPEFEKAVTEGRREFKESGIYDMFLKRANGYSYRSKRIRQVTGSEGQTHKEIVIEDRHIPAEPRLLIMALRMIDPQRFQNVDNAIVRGDDLEETQREMEEAFERIKKERVVRQIEAPPLPGDKNGKSNSN